MFTVCNFNVEKPTVIEFEVYYWVRSVDKKKKKKQ